MVGALAFAANFLLQAPLINRASLSEGFGFSDEGHLFQIKGEFLIFGGLKQSESEKERERDKDSTSHPPVSLI